MSTDWGIGCRTCRDAGKPHFTGDWNNCRDLDALWTLIKSRDAIIAVKDALGHLAHIGWDSPHPHFGTEATGLVEFFKAHEGHTLAPMNEYGAFDDQCWKYVQCEHCGSSREKCRRQAEHDGPCSLVADVTGARDVDGGR